MIVHFPRITLHFPVCFGGAGVFLGGKMEKRICTKCRGKGSFLPPHAFVSDWKQCHICDGVGTLPATYIVKKEIKKRKRVRYVRKTDGMDDLKELGE